jgi:4-hydroxy-tetrahydrodipicolinate synthase
MNERNDPTTDLRGIFTPLLTPLTEDEKLDLASLGRLVDFQIDRGVRGIWAMGTTGEFAAFTAEERASAIEAVVRQSKGRAIVIANVSDAATRLALCHAERAEAAGADAVAATPPYYYPHSQDELLAHYRAISRATSLPLFIYNIPQTVRVAVGLATAIELAEEGTVAGIKDSQNNLEWFRELTLRLARSAPTFRAFAGTRHLIDAAVLAGAAGAIPSIANAHPELCVSTYESAAAGDFAAARRTQSQIIEIESEIKPKAGSKNAATLGGLKAALRDRGVLATATVTAPLLPD